MAHQPDHEKKRFVVTRAHLKNARDHQNWDLLDKLLEIDSRHINDNALYSDGWGDWWGLLLECVYHDQADRLRVLLKHGTKKNVGRWGDGLPESPLEVAAAKPNLLRLLKKRSRPHYVRQSDPPLPVAETVADQSIIRQGQIRDATGLVFDP